MAVMGNVMNVMPDIATDQYTLAHERCTYEFKIWHIINMRSFLAIIEII